MIDRLLDLEPRAVDSDFERAFAAVGASRRALVAVFTDLVDVAAARSLLAGMPTLARRHAVHVLSAADPTLTSRVADAPRSRRELAAAVVAQDVLASRANAAAQLRRAGATVIEAPAKLLGANALRAYIEAKARARL